MAQVKMNKTLSKIMIMAVLMTELLFIETHDAVGQEFCKSWTQFKQEGAGEAERIEARDCWVRKAKLTGDTLSGALAKNPHTKGIDFKWWIREGGKLTR